MHFLIGLLAGALSGLLTYAVSVDSRLALIVAAVVAVLYWVGIVAIIVIDD